MSTVNDFSQLNYKPVLPQSYSPEIGLIGCGGITEHHLRAYKEAGLRVTAVCDVDQSRAQNRADEFFPEARVLSDYRALLDLDGVEVVDITTHPPVRPPIIADALDAGKHVLSQKPFVLDLDEGEKLVAQASEKGLTLAVNQNGRWAPHFSYARVAVESGLMGDVFAVHMGCHWDHTWVAGTPFENIKHLVLYDYAIHWFDMVRCLLSGARATRVFASTSRVPGQQLMPNMLGQVLIEFDQAQSTLSFDAAVPHGPLEETYVAGTKASLHSYGSGNQDQSVRLTNNAGTWQPRLEGKWFPDGFLGTMGELLCSIEDKRDCAIRASDNLESLALCFAAIQSAETGLPVTPGQTRKLPE